MTLRTKQIENVLRQVSKNILLYISASLGEAVLTESDWDLLKHFGIAKNSLGLSFPPYYKMYLLGRLTQMIGDKNSSQLTYADFEAYLKRNQFEPLTPFEEIQYTIARQATYHHLKNLDDRVRREVEEGVFRMLTRSEYENIVGEEIATGIKERKSIRGVISDIGHKTGDWKKDIGRIVDTEMNNIFQQGRAVRIAEKNKGKDPLVYKDVYEGACRHCIHLYLKHGLGSEPIIFTLSELAANGSNIGRKVADWKATINGTHPWCRCTLREKNPYMIWDKDKKMFVYDMKTINEQVSKLNVRGTIKVTVNNKEYVVES